MRKQKKYIHLTFLCLAFIFFLLAFFVPSTSAFDINFHDTYLVSDLSSICLMLSILSVLFWLFNWLMYRFINKCLKLLSILHYLFAIISLSLIFYCFLIYEYALYQLFQNSFWMESVAISLYISLALLITSLLILILNIGISLIRLNRNHN